MVKERGFLSGQTHYRNNLNRGATGRECSLQNRAVRTTRWLRYGNLYKWCLRTIRNQSVFACPFAPSRPPQFFLKIYNVFALVFLIKRLFLLLFSPADATAGRSSGNAVPRKGNGASAELRSTG